MSMLVEGRIQGKGEKSGEHSINCTEQVTYAGFPLIAKDDCASDLLLIGQGDLRPHFLVRSTNFN
jgi:hypothetical protein